MNSVVLIGRLTKDPEQSFVPNTQNAITKFTLACETMGKADFIRITCFGKNAENCGRYLSKGKETAIAGRISTGSYTNKEGKTVYTTDVIADKVEFLGSKSNAPKEEEANAFIGADDDIPF